MINKFSLSMSVYQNDEPEYFRNAFLSIINQTLVPSEIVLVVDGPIPIKTYNLISEFKLDYSFLKVINIKQNQGHGNSRRVGLNECTNDIVALMDSDDISVHNRFELQHEFLLNNPKVSLVGGQIEEFIGTPENIVSKREVPNEHGKIKEFLKSRSPFNQMTVMFRKSHVLNSGGYVDFYHNEDYYLWIRMFLCNYKFHNLPDVLVKARVNSEFYKRRGGVKYFLSEYKVQQIMYRNSIISTCRFLLNISIRFILQIVLGESLRGFVFKKLARKKI